MAPIRNVLLDNDLWNKIAAVSACDTFQILRDFTRISKYSVPDSVPARAASMTRYRRTASRPPHTRGQDPSIVAVSVPEDAVPRQIVAGQDNHTLRESIWGIAGADSPRFRIGLGVRPTLHPSPGVRGPREYTPVPVVQNCPISANPNGIVPRRCPRPSRDIRRSSDFPYRSGRCEPRQSLRRIPDPVQTAASR